ncbi:TldD/PmbA family protein [Candidatus Woesearchaeota archaeon]|nr:TldD/PmbA family protein [Candidatus Woesearchaeota archaeon]
MEEIAEYILNLLKENKAGYCEVRAEKVKSSAFVLKNSNLELGETSVNVGIGARYTINGSLGFLAVNDFNKEKIKELVEKSIRLTKKCQKKSDNVSFGESDINIQDYKVKQNINLESVDASDYLKTLNEVDNSIKDVDGRYFQLSSEVANKYFINSDGSKIKAEIPRVGVFYLLTLVEGSKSLNRKGELGMTGGFEVLNSFKLNERVVNEVNALKNTLNRGVKLKSEAMDVVCGPEVVGIAVHESGGHPYEADRICGRESAQAGESFLNKDYLGKQLGNEKVTIVDDPTIESGYGYFLYDDEGVKAKRKFLMKDGVVNDFLHNRETAVAMGMKNNGSARASDYNKEVLVRMSNTLMLPGDHEDEEIIKDVKKGVYIKNFMEWNIDDKRWQQKYVGSEAYLIEKGEIVKPVINPVLEITTPALYKAIDAIGKKIELHAGSCGKGEPMQGIPVSMGGPMIRLRNVHIK